MDIKEMISQAIEKITKDNKLLSAFKADPKAAVKTVVGDGLSEDVLNQVITAVKAKLGAEAAAETVDKLKDGLSGLFGKK